MIREQIFTEGEDIKIGREAKRLGLDSNEWITILVLREIGELNSVFDMKTAGKKRKWLQRRITGAAKVNLEDAIRAVLRGMGGTATTPQVMRHVTVLYPRLKFSYAALYRMLGVVGKAGGKEGKARIWHLEED